MSPPPEPDSGRRRLLWWRGPDPDRVDAASVDLLTDRLTALGSSTTADYALSYRLETSAGWITTRVEVDARGSAWERSIRLGRDGDTWSATWAGDGVDGLELPDLSAALDCDLGLCPLTNTMPVLRHDLVAAARSGGGEPVDFVMAWVSVPDLVVHADAQRYTPEGPVHGGGALVRYESGDFRATIELDADGLVINYPGLAHRR